MTFADVEQIIIALENSGSVPLVRVRENDANCIGQVLDMGARIVAVPHVDNAADARRAVQSAKYYPLGRRGYSTCNRSTRQGMQRLDLATMKEQNASTMLMVQIESEEAVRNAAEIAGVEGIAILFIGSADLSQDMGISPDLASEMQAAVATVSKAIKAAGKIGGLTVSDPSSVASYSDLGFNLICCGLDTLVFKNAAVSLLNQFRTGKEQ